MLLWGEAHRLKPPTLATPTLARHQSNCLHELFWQEVLVRNMELINHQPEELGKGQKETPHVRPPPRILLTGIHIDWTRHAPPGRTLSQNDWVKDNPETNPITTKHKTAMWQSSSPTFPYPTALRPGPQ